VLGRRPHSKAQPDLRALIFATDPALLGLPPDGNRHVWGVVFDLAGPDGVASLVSLADGTTSLYTSTGGGVIGGGTHEEVAANSVALVFGVEAVLDQFIPTDDRSLPSEPHVRVWALTYSGVRMVESFESDLQRRDHPLAHVYLDVQEVLTILRSVEEGGP